MNIHLLYEVGETSSSLTNQLVDSGCNVTHKDSVLLGKPYQEIRIKDDNASISERLILNQARAIALTENQEACFEILRNNKINCIQWEEDAASRIYHVLVFELGILSIKVEMKSKDKTRVKYIKETENTRVADIARRTLILLGLDLAMVNIVLTTRRRLRVSAIDTSPQLRSKDIVRLAEKLTTLHLQHSTEVKLGADPEFMLVNNRTGRMVAASDFFPKEGIVGCDAIRIPSRQQRPVAEVRPYPDRNPLDLVVNIKQALRNAARLAPYQNVKWVAGSQPFPGYSIGGHIHFSSLKLNSAVLRALDNYLGIPVFLIENPNTACKRRKKYGFLSDYRIKDHGGFEYRTPGSWLVSRDIAAAVLCLAKIVASRYTKLTNNFLNNVEAQQAFYQGDQEYFRNIFPRLWRDIEALDMAKDYHDEISILPYMIENRIAWDEKKDLRKTWKIIGSKKKSAAEAADPSFDRRITDPYNDTRQAVVPATGRVRRGSNRGGRNEEDNTINRSQSPTQNANRTAVWPAGVIGLSELIRPPASAIPRLGRVVGPGQIRRAHTTIMA